jgi:glycine/D-amino acid oxidase-like deaminating enzyme
MMPAPSTFELDRADLETHLKPYVAKLFPLLDPEPVLRETCLYTNTPDEDFVLDFVPGTTNVVVGGGGSGHAFKLGPVIGRILSELALAGRASTDVSMFSATRPVLLAAASPVAPGAKLWMNGRMNE